MSLLLNKNETKEISFKTMKYRTLIVVKNHETLKCGEKQQSKEIISKRDYFTGKCNELLGEHALLVVGRGRTPDRVDFLVS